MKYKLYWEDFKFILRSWDEILVQPARKFVGLRERPVNHIYIARMKFLDELKECFIRELDGAREDVAYGPCVGMKAGGVKAVRLPPVRLYEFEHVKCMSSQSAFFSHGLLVVERIEGVDSERCDFNGPFIYMQGDRLSMLRRNFAGKLKNGIFLGGSGASNYYHWMIEILPKLQYIDRLGPEYDDYPLLVCDSALKYESVKKSLACMNPGKEVIYLEQDRDYEVGHLLHISPPNIIPFNLKPNQTIRLEDHFFRQSSLEYVRNSLIRGLTVAPADGCGRLFFARKIKRRNYNEDEIFELFEAVGFRKVYMAELTLKEQIEHVRSAEYIAGPTGAEWTNLIFCNAGTKAICWMNAAISGFSCFSNLAHYAEVDLRYICFPSKVTITKRIYSETYELSKEVVSDALSKLQLFE